MKKRRNRVYWLALGLALALSALYAHRTGLADRYRAHHERQQDLEAARSEVSGLQDQLERTSRQVDGLQGDALEIEAAIRRTMHHVRPGETVFRVTPPPEAASEADP